MAELLYRASHLQPAISAEPILMCGQSIDNATSYNVHTDIIKHWSESRASSTMEINHVRVGKNGFSVNMADPPRLIQVNFT